MGRHRQRRLAPDRNSGPGSGPGLARSKRRRGPPRPRPSPAAELRATLRCLLPSSRSSSSSSSSLQASAIGAGGGAADSIQEAGAAMSAHDRRPPLSAAARPPRSPGLPRTCALSAPLLPASFQRGPLRAPAGGASGGEARAGGREERRERRRPRPVLPIRGSPASAGNPAAAWHRHKRGRRRRWRGEVPGGRRRVALGRGGHLAGALWGRAGACPPVPGRGVCVCVNPSGPVRRGRKGLRPGGPKSSSPHDEG